MREREETKNQIFRILEVTNNFCPENLQKSSLAPKKYNVIYVDPNVRKLKCSLCGIRFGTQKNLELHVRSIHEGIIRKNKQKITNQSNVSSKGQIISE